MKKHTIRFKEIVLAVLTAAVILTLLEVAFRLIPQEKEPYEDFYEDIYLLSYAMTPGAVNPYSHVREVLNSSGFRGQDYPEQKPSGSFRILCLGDSCTFGFPATLEQSYPYALEKYLSRQLPGRKIEVINGGIPGTCIYQHLMTLENKLIKFDPDLVLVWSGPNWSPTFKRFRDLMEDPPFYVRIRKPLHNSMLYRRLLKMIKQGPTDLAYWQYKEHLITGEYSNFSDPSFTTDNIIADYLIDLNRLKAIADQNGFEPVFLNNPTRTGILDEKFQAPYYDSPRILQTMDQFCSKNDFLMLDLVAALRGKMDPGQFADEVHPTGEGYGILARNLGDLLIEAGKLLPAD